MKWIVLAVALAVGILLMSYDRRTDDTGIEVGLIVGSALALALVAPRVALAIALAIGLPIAILNGGVPTLLFSGVGAAIGWAMRRNAIATRPG